MVTFSSEVRIGVAGNGTGGRGHSAAFVPLNEAGAASRQSSNPVGLLDLTPAHGEKGIRPSVLPRLPPFGACFYKDPISLLSRFADTTAFAMSWYQLSALEDCLSERLTPLSSGRY